jgi:hypothetical protein
MAEKKVYRKGVSFSCEICSKLLRDCAEHNPARKAACLSCKGDLKKVGMGNSLLGGAMWFRCLNCKKYFMFRRNEMVEAQERGGFRIFT